MKSWHIQLYDNDVVVERPSGTRESVAWNDLIEVAILTTDAGPFGSDVFLVLTGTQGGCAIPQDVQGYDAVYERVSALEGFNFESVIAAMSSTQNAKFILWKKS